MSEILRTKGDVYKLPNDVLMRKMKDPKGLAEINAALSATAENPVLSPEEQAAKEADAKVAADAAIAEAARVAAETEAAKNVVTDPVIPVPPTPKSWETEDAAYKNLGITISRDAEGNPVRFVQDYQIKDENGNAIGRPTHLEAKDMVELLQKKDECHVQATRALTRLKDQKIKFKTQQAQPEPVKELTETEYIALMEDVKGKDSAKAAAAIRKIAGSEVAKERQAAREAAARAEGQRISYEFMKRHPHDFNPCQANSDIIGKYLQENDLEYTVDNLELAFMAKEKELAPVIEPERPTPPAANPTVTASPEVPKKRTVVITKGEAYPDAQPGETLIIIEKEPVVAAAPPAVVPTPTSPAVSVNPELPASRPGVNGGIAPGTLSGTKPANTSAKLTRADIIKMAKNEPAKFKRLVGDPKSRVEMNAILAGQA